MKKKSFDDRTVTRIIQAVTTAVLISLSEASKGSKLKEEERGQAEEALMWMASMCMMVVVAVSMMCFAAAVSKLQRRRKKESRSAAMADVETVKKFITEDARSIEATNFLASQLNKEQKDRMEEGETKKEVERLNALREDAPTPPASSAPRPEEDEKKKKEEEE